MASKNLPLQRDSLALGSQVLVCDNLSFFGEVVLTRRHTRFIERDLPDFVAAFGRLQSLPAICIAADGPCSIVSLVRI